MPEDARETILQNASANVADYAARSFYQYVAGCLAKMIVRAGIYVLTFLVISLLLFLLYMLLSLALRMASLGGLNRVMGAVFGGVSVYMDGIYHPALCRGNLRRQCIDAADTR